MAAQIPGVTGFLRPGVYVRSTVRDITVTTPTGLRTVLIIGRGDPVVQSFTRRSGTKLTLSFAPVFKYSSLQAGYPDYPFAAVITKNGVTLTEGTDFELDPETGEVTFSVALIRTDEITATYHNFSVDYFSDVELMKIKHGQPSATNLCALGAQVAFENGAATVGVIRVPDPIGTETEADVFNRVFALPTLVSDGGVFFQATLADMVVPIISTDAPVYVAENINYACKLAVEFASTLEMKMEMVGILGSPRFETLSAMFNALIPTPGGRVLDTDGVNPEESIIDVASETSYGDNSRDNTDFTRTMYIAMDLVQKELADGTTAYFNGSLVACALAGKIGSFLHAAYTTTNKDLVGFKVPRSRRLTRLQGNRLMDEARCIVLEPNAVDGAKVLWAITTDNTGSPTKEESSVLLARDYVAKRIRTEMEKYIGLLNLPSTLLDMTTTISNTLEAFKSANVIETYRGVRVDRHPIEPRQVNVFFEIRPAFPVNWISIEFAIGSAISA